MNIKVSINEEVRAVLYSAKPLPHVLSRIVLVIMPFAGVLWSPNSLSGRLALPFSLLLIYMGLCLLDKATRRTIAKPKVQKRFTVKATDGKAVSIEKGKLYEAILYLSECEDYFERGGQ